MQRARIDVRRTVATLERSARIRSGALLAAAVALCASALAFAEEPTLARPPVDERVQALGRALFAAVQRDDPSLAQECFFPRDAFLQVKAMQDPGRYWDRLHRRFATDIHALHVSLEGMAAAEFDHLELVARGGLVKPGEEGNKLAYWASRHSRLHYKLGEARKSFEVRVMISWKDRWYVIHLSPFQ